jgi:hypothetical protein
MNDLFIENMIKMIRSRMIPDQYNCCISERNEVLYCLLVYLGEKKSLINVLKDLEKERKGEN